MTNRSDTDAELGLQVLSLCFARPGAVDALKRRIEPNDLLIAGKGAKQILGALYDFHTATQVSAEESIDSETFRRWLKNETDVYNAIGEEEGLDVFFEQLPKDSGEKVEAVAGYVRHRNRINLRKRVAEQLQNLAKSDLIGDESQAEFSEAISQLRKLSSISGDPMSQIETGSDILTEVDSLWELPDFLPTQFKGLNKAMGYDEETGGFCKGAVHAIVAQSGKGKPLWVNTKVQMGDGSFRKLGDIKVGDLVITKDGAASEVTEIHEQGELPTLKITMESGRIVYSALDHGFLTEHGWCEAQDLQVGEPLLMPDYIDVEASPQRDVADFKKEAKQINHTGVPDWVMKGFDAQIQAYIGVVFNRFGRFLAAKYSTTPKVVIDDLLFQSAAQRLQGLMARLGIYCELTDKGIVCTDAPSADIFRNIIPLEGRNKRMADNWTPKDGSILNRKGQYIRDYITNIESDEARECRCITVDREHSFLAEGLIVHNSTFAKSLMNHWVDTGNTVLFYNYEEAKAHWKRVLFSQITKQNVYKSREMSDAERAEYTEIFCETFNRWKDRFMVKHDPDSPYFEDLEDQIRSMWDAGVRFDVLIIDTIQSLFLRRGQNGARWSQYEEMMVHLEKLAKDLDVVIVLTAQENSNRMKDNRSVVQQSDAGGSLTIMQKSAVAIFLTNMQGSHQKGNDDDMVSNTLNDGLMQLQMPKNRITGQEFVLDAPIVQYVDEYKLYQEAENIIPRSQIDANQMEDLTDGLVDFALENAG